jgi:hypothetical protein
MRSRITTVFLMTAIIGLVLLMLSASLVGSSSSSDDYATAVFGVS